VTSDVITLALDASTYVGTVAVLHGSRIVAVRETAMRGEQEERLMPAVAATLAEAAVSPRALARIVCGAGPGSFTSLRIAGAIAKGLAVAAEAPLYAVSSLALLVAAAEPALPAGRYLAVLDALRGEAYAAVVTVGGSAQVVECQPVRIAAASELERMAREERCELLGVGTTRVLAPHARGAARLDGMLADAAAVDVASWEPSYGRLAEAQVKWEAVHGRPLARR